jgi:hypothetical protein
MQKNLEKKEEKPKNKNGRPLEYTKQVGNLICELVATHPLGLPSICRMYEGLPSAKTIQRWRHKVADFRLNYAHAKVEQADLLAEECLQIADDSTPENVAVDRLRVDSRKWLASKLLPKQYGDKLLLEQKTEENEKLKEELLALRATLDEANKKAF